MFRLAAFVLGAALLSLRTPSATAQGVICLRCASEFLRDQWPATSLARYPQEMLFNAKCDKSDDILEAPDYRCSNGTACIELSVAVGKAYGFVRGCVEDFIDAKTVRNYTFSGEAAWVAVTNSSKSNVYLHYCGSAKCNGELGPKTLAANNDKKVQQPIGAVAVPTGLNQSVECVQCLRFGDENRCNPNQLESCSGAYCVQSQGRLRGVWFENRGCVALNPLFVTSMHVEFDSELTLGGITSPQNYTADSVYCSTAKCNNVDAFSTLPVTTTTTPLVTGPSTSTTTEHNDAVGAPSWAVVPVLLVAVALR